MDTKEMSAFGTSLSSGSSTVIRRRNPNGVEMLKDVNFKSVFSHKEIIAVVAKYLIEELEEYSPNEIVEMIGSVFSSEVSPGMGGASVESSIPGESTVRFDILTTINLPAIEDKLPFRIRVNIEMQRRDRPGYSLGKRAMYYCSRMISDQLEVVTGRTTYDDVEPVHSIWIVLTTNNDLKNSVVKYSMQRETCSAVNDSLHEMDTDVDLVNIYFAFINKRIKEIDSNTVDEGILEFLTMLFQGNYNNPRMKEKYVDFTSNELIEEITTMSEQLTWIEEEIEEEKKISHEEGLAEGREKGLAEGREEGEERLSKLIREVFLHETSDIAMKVATDKKLREFYYNKYGI